jgi:hypothetical protein
MSWNIFAVQTAEDTDGRMYPLIGSAETFAELEPGDGEIRLFRGTGLSISEAIGGGSLKQYARFKDIPIDVMITDTRTVFSITKWNKGGRAWGIGLGATSALITNVSRSITEARARRGQLMLGHIRHNWLSHVGLLGTGWGSSTILRLACQDGFSDQKRLLIVQVGLPRSESPTEIANLIASKAAEQWLASGRASVAQNKEKLEALASGRNPLPEPQKGQVNLHAMPVYQKAHFKTVWEPDVTDPAAGAMGKGPSNGSSDEPQARQPDTKESEIDSSSGKMSIAIRIVQAMMDDDQAALHQSFAEAEKVGPVDLLPELGQFFARFRSGVTEEHKTAMRQEVDAVTGPADLPEEMRRLLIAAVRDIATPLMVDIDPLAAGEAINRHFLEMTKRADNLMAGVIVEIFQVAARIATRLKIKLVWT